MDRNYRDSFHFLSRRLELQRLSQRCSQTQEVRDAWDEDFNTAYVGFEGWCFGPAFSRTVWWISDCQQFISALFGPCWLFQTIFGIPLFRYQLTNLAEALLQAKDLQHLSGTAFIRPVGSSDRLEELELHGSSSVTRIYRKDSLLRCCLSYAADLNPRINFAQKYRECHLPQASRRYSLRILFLYFLESVGQSTPLGFWNSTVANFRNQASLEQRSTDVL